MINIIEIFIRGMWSFMFSCIAIFTNYYINNLFMELTIRERSEVKYFRFSVHILLCVGFIFVIGIL